MKNAAPPDGDAPGAAAAAIMRLEKMDMAEENSFVRN
jgi:hypothetical protein